MGAVASCPWTDRRVIVPTGKLAQEVCVVAEVFLDPACYHEQGYMPRTRSVQGQSGRLRVTPACPGVINQQHVGAPRQPYIRAEVPWVNVAWVLNVGGGREADL